MTLFEAAIVFGLTASAVSNLAQMALVLMKEPLRPPTAWNLFNLFVIHAGAALLITKAIQI